MLEGCPMVWGAAWGCWGILGGCPTTRGGAPAPRAPAQLCGPAEPGGCSPGCSRRCPRCAGTAGENTGMGGWEGRTTRTPPHLQPPPHPTLTISRIWPVLSTAEQSWGGEQSTGLSGMDQPPLFQPGGTPKGAPPHPISPPPPNIAQRFGGTGQCTPSTHRLQHLRQPGAEQDDVPAGRKVVQGGEKVPGEQGGELSASQGVRPAPMGAPPCPPRTC